jgi:hypothetical protein
MTQRFGHELIDPAVVQRYREQDQPPTRAAQEHYGAVLSDATQDAEALERRLELLRDAEADIAAEQQVDAEERARW